MAAVRMKGSTKRSRLAGHEYYAPGNLPVPKLLQHLVNLGQRARARLASDFSRGAQGQDFPQVLPGADGGSLDAHFRRSHQDWRKTE
jgi:hypothetical protein